MARIDEDIVAKASFYAGLSQTYAPEEVPLDIRSNGNSLLRDVVDSICNDKEVDRGQTIVTKTLVNGCVDFDENCGVVPQLVMNNGKKLTPVGIEDFYTTYRNNANVYCIHNSVVTSTETNPVEIIIDQFGRVLTDAQGNILVGNSIDRDVYNDVISVKTWLGNADVDIICDTAIAVDDTLGYLRVDCRKAVRSYVTDYLSFLMASMYGVTSKDDCWNRMQISLNHCKKPVATHQTYADPMEGMKRMMNACNSPKYNRGGSNPLMGV